MLIIHHLGISQSERVLWLCEELEISYKLVKHVRDPVLSPESLKVVPGNDTGKSPFIEDTDAGITLSESGAILEYIITLYGNGKMAVPSGSKNYSDYLHWFHFANGTLQPAMVDSMFLDMVQGISEDDPIKLQATERLTTALKVLDSRLARNKWLAGDQFSAADIMNVYCLTTQRYFGPLVSLGLYGSILRYLQDCAARPAYQRAMEKGDPDMKLLLGAEPPEISMGAAGGTKSDHWRK